MFFHLFLRNSRKILKQNVMKINQLFIKHVDEDLVLRILKCFGLTSFDDKKTFCKLDLVRIKIVEKLKPHIDELRAFYLPCKAKVYLDNMDERKAITVLKQVLRLHDVYLKSKEKNFHNRKVMFYTLIREKDRHQINYMQQFRETTVITFE